MLGWARNAGQRRASLALGVAVFLAALTLLATAGRRPDSEQRLSPSAAVRSALANRGVDRSLGRSGYTRQRAIPLDERLERVSFFNGRRIVLDVAVAPDGSVPHVNHYGAGYVRAGNDLPQKPVALLVLCVVFVLMTARLPISSLSNLDLVALLGFVASIVLLNERLFEFEPYVSYPLLAYLGLRCLRVARQPSAPARARASRSLLDAITPRWGDGRRTRGLAFAAAAAALALAMVSVPGGSVVDVGFASMAGATDLLHGALPYGHMPTELVHGDTYPLLAYALYIPAALVAPVHDAFSNLDGALYVTAASSLLVAAAIYVAGLRLDPGGHSDGIRLAIAWLVFPPALITASSGSNDLVAAACVAWALVFIACSARATLLLTIAGWVKLVPLFLIPICLARFRSRATLRAVVAAGAVTAAVLAWIALLAGTGGLREMVKAISFQDDRGSLLSLWTLVGVGSLQLGLQAAVISLVALSALWVRRDRELASDPRRLAALAGAVMIGFQLAANYWTPAYLTWLFPCLALALLSGSRTGQRRLHA
jgi:hypothetical protein